MDKKVFLANGRGETEAGWLHSRHSFSFGNYHNPKMMGFRVLRVLNDDIIEGGSGFGMHPHENMEIISIVLEGKLTHRDSEGNKGTLKAGEVQVMSAGSGITHSEQNASKTERAKFLQIWIETATPNATPAYSQKKFEEQKYKNRFLEIVSGQKGSAPLKINQDARVLLTELGDKQELTHIIGNKRGVFVFVISGEVEVEKETLKERDAIGITGAREVKVKARKPSKILLIEVPME